MNSILIAFVAVFYVFTILQGLALLKRPISLLFAASVFALFVDHLAPVG